MKKRLHSCGADRLYAKSGSIGELLITPLAQFKLFEWGYLE
jgi:hypothetical protein